MSKNDMFKITAALDEPYAAYFPAFAVKLGLTASVILCRFVYWNSHAMNSKYNYFFKTSAQIYKETGIRADAQTRAIKKLREYGLIADAKYDFRHRRMFKVNMAAVMNLANAIRENGESVTAKSGIQMLQNHKTNIETITVTELKQRSQQYFEADESGLAKLDELESIFTDWVNEGHSAENIELNENLFLD